MRKRIIKIILLAAIMLFGGDFATMKNTQAEDVKSSMFVTPMSQKILLIPGESYEGVISVSNAAGALENLKYKIDIGSYGVNKSENAVDDYDGGIDVQTKTARNEMMDWITVSKKSGEVAPNNTDKITFRIDVPETAPAGAQYATILVIKDDSSENDGSGSNEITVQSIYQLASKIIANVAGENIEKGMIMDNSIPSFLMNNQLEATSMVKNEGNIYTDAEYILQVWPLFSDEEICTNEEDPETSLVLPDTERYHAQSCNLPSVGIFRAKQTVKIFGETSIVEKTIIVCPLWLLFIIIFAIIALIIWFITRTKSHRKNKSHRTPDTTAKE